MPESLQRMLEKAKRARKRATSAARLRRRIEAVERALAAALADPIQAAAMRKSEKSDSLQIPCKSPVFSGAPKTH